jgi:hypothetical protein
LAFEEKDSGIQDRITGERLKSLLGKLTGDKVKLVFVSACHSEIIGNIFLQARVPIVVCVNSESMILSEVCGLFARNFYNYLFNGMSPNEAFSKS